MIGIYKRLSIADGDLNEGSKDISNSIESQGRLIMLYIEGDEELRNAPAIDYTDDGYTGTNFDRPAFKKLMEAVKSGLIDTVIVKDLSRFGRDYIEVGRYLEEVFPLFGVRFIAVNNRYDSKSLSGMTMGLDMAVSNLVNTMYSRDIGKKLVSANKIRWAKGIPTHGRAPYGYKIDPNNHKHYIIDNSAAEVVKAIFSMALNGKTTSKIGNYLNDNNVPIPAEYNRQNNVNGKENHYMLTPHGIWTSDKIRLIIRNYAYTGAMVLGKSRKLFSCGKKIVQISREEQFITENAHEAIVTHDEFLKAQNIIRKQVKAVKRNHSYALSKKIRCGYCKRLMHCERAGKEPKMFCIEAARDYKHSFCSKKRYFLKDIENAAFKKLKEVFKLLEKIRVKEERERSKVEALNAETEAEKAELNSKIETLQKEKALLYIKYIEKEISLKEYKAAKIRLDKQIAILGGNIEKLEGKRRRVRIKEIPLEVQTLIRQLRDFADKKSLTIEMAKTYIDCVYVYSPENFAVRFLYQDEIKSAAVLFGIETKLFEVETELVEQK